MVAVSFDFWTHAAVLLMNSAPFTDLKANICPGTAMNKLPEVDATSETAMTRFFSVADQSITCIRPSACAKMFNVFPTKDGTGDRRDAKTTLVSWTSNCKLSGEDINASLQ